MPVQFGAVNVTLSTSVSPSINLIVADSPTGPTHTLSTSNSTFGIDTTLNSTVAFLSSTVSFTFLGVVSPLYKLYPAGTVGATS